LDDLWRLELDKLRSYECLKTANVASQEWMSDSEDDGDGGSSDDENDSDEEDGLEERRRAALAALDCSDSDEDEMERELRMTKRAELEEEYADADEADPEAVQVTKMERKKTERRREYIGRLRTQLGLEVAEETPQPGEGEIQFKIGLILA
jgi:hypothetical protein